MSVDQLDGGIWKLSKVAARARSELAGAVHRARRLPGGEVDGRDRRIASFKRITAGFDRALAAGKSVSA